MTTRDEELQKEVQRIVDKYDQSVYKLSQYATAKEFKTVMKYVADFANRRQREIAGLEPTETKWIINNKQRKSECSTWLLIKSMLNIRIIIMLIYL